MPASCVPLDLFCFESPVWTLEQNLKELLDHRGTVERGKDTKIMTSNQEQQKKLAFMSRLID